MDARLELFRYSQIVCVALYRKQLRQIMPALISLWIITKQLIIEAFYLDYHLGILDDC